MVLKHIVVELGPFMAPNKECRVRAWPRDNLEQDIFKDPRWIDVDRDDRRDKWIGGRRQRTGGISHWSVV